MLFADDLRAIQRCYDEVALAYLMTTEEPRQPDSPSPKDEAEALEHVVDDLEPREAAIAWLCERMLAGQSADELAEALARDGGWSAESADELVEEARRQTRHQRGVVTRDDVVRDVNLRYRQSMTTGWFTAMPTLSAARRLITSIANLMSLKRRRRGN